MNILDIILAIILVLAIVNGLRKGLISQLVSIISLILGVWLSFKFSSALSVWLAQNIEASSSIINVLSFITIFVLVILGLNIVGKILEQSIKLVMLGWLNRLLGSLFGLLKAVLILGLILSLTEPFILKIIASEEPSTLSPIIQNITNSIFPYLESYFNAAKETIMGA